MIKVAKTTDEIFDLLVALDKQIGEHIAVTQYRLNALEAAEAAKGVKRWQFWTAMSASPVFGAALAWIGIKTGA